jgi:hypothetical protein
MKKCLKTQFLVILCFSLLFAVPQINKPAPDFTIYNLETGDSTTLSDFRGEKVVLLISGNLC